MFTRYTLIVLVGLVVIAGDARRAGAAPEQDAFLKAQRLTKAGKYRQAIVAYEGILKTKPKDKDVLSRV
ncbi:MAG: hypothetical protein ACK2U9_19365, partial [Anaerolineae bacterium]